MTDDADRRALQVREDVLDRLATETQRLGLARDLRRTGDQGVERAAAAIAAPSP
jgi:hypothetical protein